MKTKIYFQIALRIILLFTTGMIMSYMKPWLHDYLGDTFHVCKSIRCNHSEFINDGYDWSGTHYWFFWMCFFLFILSLVNCIISIVKIVNKEYNL